jgi:hypothetical protein
VVGLPSTLVGIACLDAITPDATLALARSTRGLDLIQTYQLDAVKNAFKRQVTKTKAPLLLRLAFHDAATYSVTDRSGGPNASIQFELDRAENKGLKRGWNTVMEVGSSRIHTNWKYIDEYGNSVAAGEVPCTFTVSSLDV